MIIRVFRAQLKPGKRADFVRLTETMSLPLMRSQSGMLAVNIAQSTPKCRDEFILVSVWRDQESLQAFAGERWQEATILPGEADLLFTARVEHYNETYSSLIALWTATEETIKRRETTALATPLSDAQWAAIKPLLPAPARTGRPRASDRKILEGILYILRNSCRWHDLPERYGDPVTCWRRYVQWAKSGIWERIWETLLATMEPVARQTWALALLDTRFMPIKRGRKYTRQREDLDSVG